MADLSVLVRAILSQAQEKNAEASGSGTDWLKQLRDEATTAVLAGDVEVTSVSFEGGQGQGARKFIAQDLLSVVQQALEYLTGTSPDRPIVLDYSQKQVTA